MVMTESVAKKINNFFTKQTKLECKKGEVLIQAEEEPSGVFFLVSGTVKMYTITADGQEVVVSLFKGGSFFPMNWAINDKLNKFYFETMEESVLWRAPRKAVLEYIQQDPEILFDLLSRLYSGMDGVLQRMVFLMSGTAYQRVINELIILARRFGKEFLKDGSFEVEIAVLEKDIAAESGLTRETVSREIKQLKNKKLVSVSKGALLIPNLQNLVDELDQ